jgi:hypothetical protein
VSKRLVLFACIVMILGIVSSPAAFADIIIDPAESCRAEGDRPDENRRSSTKLVVKSFKKSWIKFDLGELDVSSLETATLTVAAIDDESGNSCDLSVVNDSYTTGKDWTSDDLTWNNAPANDTLSDSALTTDATLITNFAVDGSAGTLFVIDILAALQADTDGIVQFVLHNSTGGQISFAPHDHPEAAWRPFIDATEGAGGQAKYPYPPKGETDVGPTTVLNWEPGSFAAPINGHKVYFSENFNDVNDGIGGITQSAASYAPPQQLDFETTYYWRVDEVNGAPDFTVHPGKVWSFTTEPVGYPIASVTATASSSAAGQGPENAVNGSGLSDDLHSTETETVWMSDIAGPQPTWIQFEFDRVYALHEAWVWNSNTDLDDSLGFGARDVTIEYSVDGTDYMPLGTTHEFSRAPAPPNPNYAHNTTVDFAGLIAKYVRFTVNSNWGGWVPQYGLSEVRFFHIPLRAREPHPETGATDVDVNVTLGWRAGREAAEHDAFISADEQAVIDGTAPVSTVAETSQGPLALDLGTIYYWRVDEVNESATPSTWQGDVWSFTTADSVTVDDFESYNNIDPPDPASHTIFEVWIDGFADSTRNGALAGNDFPPYCETRPAYIHGGNQAMPLSYNNSFKFSEATMTFAGGQDWTEHEVGELSLWFRGETTNAVERMYVTLNGIGTVYHDNPNATQVDAYEEWIIPLQEFAAQGVDLANVTSVTIGFGTPGNTATPGGAGKMYFDDILLYPPRSAP